MELRGDLLVLRSRRGHCGKHKDAERSAMMRKRQLGILHPAKEPASMRKELTHCQGQLSAGPKPFSPADRRRREAPGKGSTAMAGPDCMCTDHVTPGVGSFRPPREGLAFAI